MRTIPLGLVLALVPFSGALAQEPPAREPGQPVRVTVPSLSMESVQSVSTLTGRSRRTGTSALVGSAVGFSVGVVVLAIAHEGCQTSLSGYKTCGTAPPEAEVAPLVGGLVGAGLGAFVGYLIKSDRWEEVPLGGLLLSILPQPNGLGVGARIAF